MLSVLIPTYNYNAVSLVKSLHGQLKKQNVVFEIICFDNGSKSKINHENNQINNIEFCQFTALKNNIGRSKIRNLLAQKSKYNYFLFLDADVLPASNDFIENYLKAIQLKLKVAYGGLKYEDNKPESSKLLRWVYGKEREEIDIEKRILNPNNHFSSANFLIQKNVFNKFKFDENMMDYGHEDTLFGIELVRNKITISQTNCPVYHLGLDVSIEFIAKTETAVNNLYQLFLQDKMTLADSNLLKKFSELKKLKLDQLIAFVFTKNKKRLQQKLLSKSPSIFIFDLYKLGYLCTISLD